MVEVRWCKSIVFILSHVSKNVSWLLSLNIDELLDVKHLDQEGPVVQLGENRNSFSVIHNCKFMKQL